MSKDRQPGKHNCICLLHWLSRQVIRLFGHLDPADGRLCRSLLATSQSYPRCRSFCLFEQRPKLQFVTSPYSEFRPYFVSRHLGNENQGMPCFVRVMCLVVAEEDVAGILQTRRIVDGTSSTGNSVALKLPALGSPVYMASTRALAVQLTHRVRRFASGQEQHFTRRMKNRGIVQ